MTRPVARGLGLFGGLAIVLVVAAIIYTWRRPAETTPLPNPNGFDDLVAASHLLVGNYDGLKTLEGEELRAVVGKDEPARTRARLGLSRSCRVPLPARASDWATQGPQLAGIKRLALAFAAEGKLAEADGRYGDAAQAYLNVVRLGHELARGGLIIHGLVCVAVESIGESRLEKIVNRLDATNCLAAAATLEMIESNREPVSVVIADEHGWVQHAYGLRDQVVNLFNFRQTAAMEKSYSGRAQAQANRSRVLLIELAAHAYELEHGQRPHQLSDLVPRYLHAFPQDPLTGTNMNYRP